MVSVSEHVGHVMHVCMYVYMLCTFLVSWVSLVDKKDNRAPSVHPLMKEWMGGWGLVGWGAVLAWIGNMEYGILLSVLLVFLV